MPSLSNQSKAHTTAYQGGTSASLMSTSWALPGPQQFAQPVAKVHMRALSQADYLDGQISLRQSSSARRNSFRKSVSASFRSMNSWLRLLAVILASWLTLRRESRYRCTSLTLRQPRLLRRWKLKISASTARPASATSIDSGTSPRRMTAPASTSRCGMRRERK